MSDADLDGIDWGLIGRYFSVYGLYGKAQQSLDQSQEFVRRIRKEGLQLIICGIVLGLYINMGAAWLYDAVKSLGEIVLCAFWFMFTIVLFAAVFLFIRSMTALTRQDVFRNEKEANLVHEYFIDQIKKGLDQKRLWDELNQRKYHK